MPQSHSFVKPALGRVMRDTIAKTTQRKPGTYVRSGEIGDATPYVLRLTSEEM